MDYSAIRGSHNGICAFSLSQRPPQVWLDCRPKNAARRGWALDRGEAAPRPPTQCHVQSEDPEKPDGGPVISARLSPLWEGGRRHLRPQRGVLGPRARSSLLSLPAGTAHMPPGLWQVSRLSSEHVHGREKRLVGQGRARAAGLRAPPPSTHP